MAIDFNSSASHCEQPDYPATLDALTLRIWINVPDVTDTDLQAHVAWIDSGFNVFKLYTAEDDVHFQWDGLIGGSNPAGIATFAGVLSDDTWHEIVVTISDVDGDTTIYVDRVNSSVTQGNGQGGLRQGAPFGTQAELYVGGTSLADGWLSDGSGPPFEVRGHSKAKLAELSLYDEVQGSEILDRLWAGGQMSHRAPLQWQADGIGYWPMCDYSEGATSDSDDLAQDYTHLGDAERVIWRLETVGGGLGNIDFVPAPISVLGGAPLSVMVPPVAIPIPAFMYDYRRRRIA